MPRLWENDVDNAEHCNYTGVGDDTSMILESTVDCDQESDEPGLCKRSAVV